MMRALGVIAGVTAITLLAVWWGGNRFVRAPTAALDLAPPDRTRC